MKDPGLREREEDKEEDEKARTQREGKDSRKTENPGLTKKGRGQEKDGDFDNTEKGKSRGRWMVQDSQRGNRTRRKMEISMTQKNRAKEDGRYRTNQEGRRQEKE